MQAKFKGTGVALVTPFKESGAVDYKGLEKLVEHVIAGGLEYLVVQGTTGESVTLNKEEKRAVADFIIEVNNKRLPIALGHGGNNTQSLLDGFGDFDFSGIDAILSASPYYNKPTQEGIYAHYRAVAEASPVPVILYNVPGRTSSNVAADTTLSLANDVENIIAVKEASGDLDQIGKIIRDRPDGFLVLSGDDALVVPHMALGGEGIISVIANAFPKEFSDLVRAGARGDFETARSLHYRLMEITRLLFVEGNPGGIKAALHILGICDTHVRLPLVQVSRSTYGQLEQAIESLK